MKPDPRLSVEVEDRGVESPSRAAMQPYPGIPRWVKLFAIAIVVLVVLAAIVHFGGMPGHQSPVGHHQ